MKTARDISNEAREALNRIYIGGATAGPAEDYAQANGHAHYEEPPPHQEEHKAKEGPAEDAGGLSTIWAAWR